jgi:hypothetical protein
MLITLLFLSLLINIAFGIFVWNAAEKLTKYDQYCEALLSHVRIILFRMEEIDLRGAFQADDEVGEVFSRMRDLVTTLEQFTPENNGQEED